jgi:hypothetical protein
VIVIPASGLALCIPNRQKMINQFEVPMYLEEILPDIAPSLKQSTHPVNVYQAVHVFLDYTFKKIKDHNYAVVKKCFALAEKLYSKGNNVVKCAVANVFVFSFSSIPVHNTEEKRIVMGLIPGSLYSVYMHQVLHTGI